MVVPSGTLVSMPSMVTETVEPRDSAEVGSVGRSGWKSWLSGARRRGRQVLSAMDLVSKMLEDGKQRHRTGLTQAALGGYLHGVGKPFELVQIVVASSFPL